MGEYESTTAKKENGEEQIGHLDAMGRFKYRGGEMRACYATRKFLRLVCHAIAHWQPAELTNVTIIFIPEPKL